MKTASFKGLILFLTAFPLVGGVNDDAKEGWLTYEDPRFDFSLTYPSDWIVEPRQDREGTFGELLVIREAASEYAAPVRIEIGLHSVERNPSLPIAVWSQKYDANHDNFMAEDITILDMEEMIHTDRRSREVFRKQAISPITEYTYYFIPWDRTVWFMWMNSIDGEHQEVLDRMASSFTFGEYAPGSLQEAYGPSVRPMNLEITHQDGNLPPRGPSRIGSHYTVPVGSTAYISCGNLNAPVCSGTHGGSDAGARYAIDIGVGSGTSVRNAAASIVYSYNYSGSGYGNLVKMYELGSGYIAHYAHLKSISSSVTSNYGTLTILPKYTNLGKSGSSGTTAAHLHFHVETTSNSGINLSGMSGLSLWSGYPNCGKSASDCSAGFSCTCGKVN